MHFKYTTRSKKWITVLLTAVLCMTLLSACGNDKNELNPTVHFNSGDNGEIVATYKDGTVTDVEFNKFKSSLAMTQGMDPSIFDMEGYREYMLEQYIVYKVLAQRATEEQQAEAKEEAITQSNEFFEYMASYSEFEDMLKNYNLERNDIATFMMMGSAVNKYMDSQITEEMMETEYNENKIDYSFYDVRQIIVNLAVQDVTTNEVTVTRTEEEALARAQEVKAKLEAGGSWEELAQQYSDDTTTNQTGGLYTQYMGGRWYQSVKEAVNTQELNKIGEPVLSPIGYHVIQVEKRDILEYSSLADTTKDMLRYVLTNEVMDNFVQNELPGYEINITLPEVEQPADSEGEATEQEQQEQQAVEGEQAQQ